MLTKSSGYIGIHDDHTVGRLEVWFHEHVGCIIILKIWLSLQSCLEAWVHEHVDLMMKWCFSFKWCLEAWVHQHVGFMIKIMVVLQLLFKRLVSTHGHLHCTTLHSTTLQLQLHNYTPLHSTTLHYTAEKCMARQPLRSLMSGLCGSWSLSSGSMARFHSHAAMNSDLLLH